MNVQEIRQAIQDKIEQGKKIAASQGYPIKVNLVLNFTGSRGGHYKHSTKEVMINMGLALKNDENLDHVLSVTCFHELAHAIQCQHFPPSEVHGSVWKNIMRRVYGLIPERCHNMDVAGVSKKAVAAFIYNCVRCRKEIKLTTEQHVKHKNKSCFRCKCGGDLTFMKLNK